MKLLVVVASLLTLAACLLGIRNGHSWDHPHKHFGPVNTGKPAVEKMEDIQITGLSEMTYKVISEPVSNKTRSFRAFVVDAPNPKVGDLRESLVVEDTTSRKWYRLRSELFSHRPISDLVWADDYYLHFDIWTTPHFGVHYILNAGEMRVVFAQYFHDDFIEEGEPKGKR
jgi:hypothetical protein